MAMAASKSNSSAERGPGRGARMRPRWLQRPWLAWLSAAILLALIGSASAVFVADNQSQQNASKQRQAFTASSTAIASTLRLAIQHEADLVVNASSFVTENPTVTSSGFAQWVRSEHTYQRYPELLRLAYFTTVPAGEAGVSAAAVRDTEAGGYVINKRGRATVLSAFVPIYRGGVMPATKAAREDMFLGWIELRLIPRTLLNLAMVGHPGMALTFGVHVGSTNLNIRWGNFSGLTRSRMIVLLPPWTVRVFGAQSATGILGGTRLLLLAGIALSLLLSLLVFMLGTGRDRARRLVELKTRELRHQALHDGLTELPNRALVLDRAEQMLARGRRHQLPVAAMYVDVDGFKRVNDTFGHAAGDDLLREVARRLRCIVRDGDTVARIGGDEFVILVEGSTLDAGPELVAERLLEVLRQPYEVGREGGLLSVTASVGVATTLTASVDELLGNADVALYEAKAAGRDGYKIFQSSMQDTADNRLVMQMDLTEVLERDQLFLLYQPTFDLATGETIGAEALLRWRHPTRGVVPPDEFIPVAEASGLIIPIGRWVLNEACRQAAAWHDRGHRIGIAVNVSGRQLDRDELVDEVSEALASSGLDPKTLTLEITETALMRDAEAAAHRLKLLKKLGVLIAIDDFGTGYSSMAYLRQFPVDILKIDRSFISGIAASEKSAALVHTLIQLGKSLDLETLAEGIEDRDQLQSLQREQCDHGQGFLFARPLDAIAAEEFLNAAPTQPLAPS